MQILFAEFWLNMLKNINKGESLLLCKAKEVIIKRISTYSLVCSSIFKNNSPTVQGTVNQHIFFLFFAYERMIERYCCSYVLSKSKRSVCALSSIWNEVIVPDKIHLRLAFLYCRKKGGR